MLILKRKISLFTDPPFTPLPPGKMLRTLWVKFTPLNNMMLLFLCKILDKQIYILFYLFNVLMHMESCILFLWFHLTNSFLLFLAPNILKYLFLPLGFKKLLAKFSFIGSWSLVNQISIIHVLELYSIKTLSWMDIISVHQFYIV